jgi:hypothetical protein
VAAVVGVPPGADVVVPAVVDGGPVGVGPLATVRPDEPGVV